ncbi:MAG: hypothetical protein KJO01_04305 [Gammaproteobacteria bacterium]|nr:hypothetical protein [Gammaproteobacteria bacterium]MBT8110303.1 hypothetical protein [Gammaproteobacteria bacterium]NND48251.1 hypothetical protein [Woeseiaceae bacterium]NNL45006.1 hypothetical protein [Woeseiaceae bacterium]
MNFIIGVIIATVAIAAMIALRIIAFDEALKERIKASRSGSACDASTCFNGCGPDKFDSVTGPVPDGKRAKRSAPHAS